MRKLKFYIPVAAMIATLASCDKKENTPPQGTPGMAGATITGDGTIALILDIPSLLRRYARGSASWGHR